MNSEGMISLLTEKGVKISFNPEECCEWDIYEAYTGKKIGTLEVNQDWMVCRADIDEQFQRKGVATTVVKHLVKCGAEFRFWPHDGLTYDDGRHLSEEGAAWAQKLVEQGLAEIISEDQPCEHEF